MCIKQAKQAKLDAAKKNFGKQINSLGINSVQDQLTTLAMMLLAVYEGCQNSGIQFNFNEEQMAHIKTAIEFTTIKEKSALIKKRIRESKTQEELDAITL